MTNKKLWWVRVVLILVITAIIAVAKQFDSTFAAVVGGVVLGSAIVYLVSTYGATWQKKLWWIDVVVPLVVSSVLYYLAVTLGGINFWIWAVFTFCLGISILVAHIFKTMLDKNKK